jgi:uncharacterized protein (DUF486 family)
MAVGILAANLLFGGTIDLQFAWNTFCQVVNEGALLALPIAWAVASLAQLIRGPGNKALVRSLEPIT